jgi:hypothetical protein
MSISGGLREHSTELLEFVGKDLWINGKYMRCLTELRIQMEMKMVSAGLATKGGACVALKRRWPARHRYFLLSWLFSDSRAWGFTRQHLGSGSKVCPFVHVIGTLKTAYRDGLDSDGGLNVVIH